MSTVVYIHAQAQVSTDQMNPGDRGVAGVWRLELGDSAPANALANAALDGFHSRVPVSVLEDFQFVVRSGTDPSSSVIEEAEGYEPYALSDHVGSILPVEGPAGNQRSPLRP